MMKTHTRAKQVPNSLPTSSDWNFLVWSGENWNPHLTASSKIHSEAASWTVWGMFRLSCIANFNAALKLIHMAWILRRLITLSSMESPWKTPSIPGFINGSEVSTLISISTSQTYPPHQTLRDNMSLRSRKESIHWGG